MSKKRKKTGAPRRRIEPHSSQVTQETGLALLRAAAATTTGVRPQAPVVGGTPPAPAPPTPAPPTPVPPTPASTPSPAPPAPAPDPVTVSAEAPRAPALEVGPVEGGRLEVTRFSCGVVEGVDPQALGLTYWFESLAGAPAQPLLLTLTGRRVGVQGEPVPGDTFTQQSTVHEIVPGSGRSSVTVRVRGITTGEWEVAAAPVLAGGRTGPVSTTRGTTAFDPVVRVSGPGVRLAAWPLMVALGTVQALATQAYLSGVRDLPSLRVFLLTLLACVVGTVGAKTYYLVTHRGESTGLLTVGMSVQGFVLASIATLSLGALASGLDVGDVLDVTTPGLLYGMTIGRFGCFFGGCCAGRVTASRWGLRSSNRRLFARRIPVQLLESAAAALVGTVALLLVLVVETPGGTVFVGAIAAYTFARQVLFPLRTVPRDTTHGRRITMATSALVLVAAVVTAVAA